MENMMKLGPEGMAGSIIWDDRGKNIVDQILIAYGKYAVHSLQFVYNVDGKMVPSKVHGRGGGLHFDIVTLDHPREYLTSVSGRYLSDLGGLVSITFGTNKRKYGPFGLTDDKVGGFDYSNFEYNFGPTCSFGGFHGSDYNSTVNTLGVYVRAPGSVAETETDTGNIITVIDY